MANEQNQGDYNPEPGWVFHPETGKVEKDATQTSPQPISNAAQITEVDNQPPATNKDTELNPDSIQEPIPSPSTQTSNTISWSASEFIAHSKSFGWYALLGLITVAVGVIVYLLTRDIFSVSIIAIFAILFGIIAGKKPKVIEYAINQNGLNIGNKNYVYSNFKSFSIMEEGAIDSIQILPLKRFAMPLTIYFSPDEKEQIIEILTHYLPYEDKSHDVIDRAMHRIRF